MIAALLSFVGISRAQAILLALGLAAGIASLGVGFVWGNAHATAAAMKLANEAADARVAALDQSYKSLIGDYTAKQRAATDAIARLAERLAAERSKSARAASQAKETLAHVQDASLDRPVPVAVLDLLRAQPARN